MAPALRGATSSASAAAPALAAACVIAAVAAAASGSGSCGALYRDYGKTTVNYGEYGRNYGRT